MNRWHGGFATGCLALVVCASLLRGQGQPKDLLWSHAFDLACRKVGEMDFTATTQRFGVEAVRDTNTGKGIYISEKGAITLAGGFSETTPTSRAPAWITGLDLSARKAGEAEFTKMTRVHSLELFRDPNTDQFLYVTDQGALAAGPAAGKTPAGSHPALWIHSVDVNVRKGGIKDWKDAVKVGIEIYRDANTGNLVFISETGSIAVVPEAGETKVNDKAPSWLHGLDLWVRKSTEGGFTKETRPFGVEVYREESTGTLLYVCETGHLAVARGDAKLAAPTADPKVPAWSHGWNVKARKFGEKEFTERTGVFGGEVFRDDNTRVLIYLSETGSIAAASIAAAATK